MKKDLLQNKETLNSVENKELLQSVDAKELSVAKLVSLANARAAKLAKANLNKIISKFNTVPYFNKYFISLFSILLKLRNNKIYRLIRLIGKIYLGLYILTLIIAVLIFSHDQFTHAIAFIKFQRQVISEIKSKFTEAINYLRKFITGSKAWSYYLSDYNSIDDMI